MCVSVSGQCWHERERAVRVGSHCVLCCAGGMRQEEKSWRDFAFRFRCLNFLQIANCWRVNGDGAVRAAWNRFLHSKILIVVLPIHQMKMRKIL